MSFHLLGVLYLICFSIYTKIMALCKLVRCPIVCIVLTVLHVISTSNHLTIPPCYSNQQQPKTSASFTCSACVSSTTPFFNLTNTELYNLLLFDNSDLSNFIESFSNFQTKYTTLSETGEMNHASKNTYIFTLMYVAWEKISTT